MDDPSAESVEVLCDNNTSFVTRPLMIGKFQDLALPFVTTLTQAILFVAMFVALLVTHHFWGGLSTVTAWVKLPALVGIPAVVARTLSNPKAEGRPILRTVAGHMRLVLNPSVWSNDRPDSRTVESVQVPLPVLAERRRGQR